MRTARINRCMRHHYRHMNIASHYTSNLYTYPSKSFPEEGTRLYGGLLYLEQACCACDQAFALYLALGFYRSIKPSAGTTMIGRNLGNGTEATGTSNHKYQESKMFHRLL